MDGLAQAAAEALQQGGGGQQQGGGQPQGGQQQQQGGGGNLAQFAQAYARCEQTKQCTPQDLQILQQGLPNLVQMVQNTQQIIQAMSRQGGQQQGGAPR